MPQEISFCHVVYATTGIQECYFLQGLCPLVFYYGLSYRGFDLREWVCFQLLDVFIVG